MGSDSYYKIPEYIFVEIIETEDNKGDPDVNGGVGRGDWDNNDLNIGLIAAGMVMPLILLAVIATIAILVLFVWKRRFELFFIIFLNVF